MTVLSLIQTGIQNTIQLYAERWKPFYAFSIAYGIVVLLIGIVFTGLLLAGTGWLFYNDATALLSTLYQNSQEFNKTGIGFAITSLSLGLYAIYLDRLADEHFETTPTLRHFFSSIYASEFKHFVAMLLAFSLLELLTIKASQSIMASENDTTIALISLLERFLSISNHILCYVALPVMLIRSNTDTINKEVLNQYKPAIVASAILLFCINAVMTSFYTYATFLLHPLVDFIFKQSVIGLCFKLFTLVAIPPLGYLAFAGFIYYPFIALFKSQQEKVTGEIDEANLDEVTSEPQE